MYQFWYYTKMASYETQKLLMWKIGSYKLKLFMSPECLSTPLDIQEKNEWYTVYTPHPSSCTTWCVRSTVKWFLAIYQTLTHKWNFVTEHQSSTGMRASMAVSVAFQKLWEIVSWNSNGFTLLSIWLLRCMGRIEQKNNPYQMSTQKPVLTCFIGQLIWLWGFNIIFSWDSLLFLIDEK